MNNRYNYRIYIASDKGYELEKITSNEGIIAEYRHECMECDGFVKLMVIRHDIALKMDEPYLLEYFPVKGKIVELGGKRKC